MSVATQMRSVVFLIVCSTIFSSRSLQAQGWDDVGFWAADYTLNILQNQATGKLVDQYGNVYEILRDGYFVVRSIVDENHSLHKEFFDQLSDVSPVVAKYYKVGLVVELYRVEAIRIKKELPTFIAALQQVGTFTPEELEVIESVFLGMVEDVADSAQELLLVAIPGESELDMMDSERIEVIDRIYDEAVVIIQTSRQYRELIKQIAAQRNPNRYQDIFKLYEILD